MRIPYLATPASLASGLRSIPESTGISPQHAAMALEEFLSSGQATVVLSGAGISVESTFLIIEVRTKIVFKDNFLLTA
jgi:hypothetical protein